MDGRLNVLMHSEEVVAEELEHTRGLWSSNEHAMSVSAQMAERQDSNISVGIMRWLDHGFTKVSYSELD